MKRIAILVAVPQELGPLSRRLKARTPAPPGLYCTRAVAGTLDTTSLLLAATGVGSRRSGRAAASVIQTWKPDLIVMAGVAGALAPDLGVGDLVIASSVISAGGVFPARVIPEAGSLWQGPPARIGALLSLDRVLITAADKREALTADTHTERPLAVEMETAGVVQVAAHRDVPWAAVRAISDSAEEALPLDFNRLRTPDGDLPTARVALAALTRPAAIPGLIRLGKNTTLAAEALADHLGVWLVGDGSRS